MQALDSATNVPCDDFECASVVIDAILLGMRTLRKGMRDGRPRDLSVPQFRLLAFVKRHDGASLTDAAEHIGLTLPSMSRAVDGLTKRGLIVRQAAEDDRRRMTLSLTDAGLSAFQEAASATRSRIVAMLSSLSPEQRCEVAHAAHVLRSLLSPSMPDSGAAE